MNAWAWAIGIANANFPRPGIYLQLRMQIILVVELISQYFLLARGSNTQRYTTTKAEAIQSTSYSQNLPPTWMQFV